MVRVLEGHDYSLLMSGCIFSPDGRYLASASEKTIRIWKAGSGRLIHTLEGHSNFVASIAFSPDGRYLVSASWDKSLRIWNMKNGKLLDTLEGHTDKINGCAISTDGTQILSASFDRTLKVWEFVASQKAPEIENTETNDVNSCSTSPDGCLIAAYSLQTKNICLWNWDLPSGQPARILSGHMAGVSMCTFSPDGRRLISGSKDQTLRLWDTDTGECIRTWDISQGDDVLYLDGGHKHSVVSCDLAADGRSILCADAEGNIFILDIPTGQVVHILQGHCDKVTELGSIPPKDWAPFIDREGFNLIETACRFTQDGRDVVSSGENKDTRLGIRHRQVPGQRQGEFVDFSRREPGGL